MNAPCIRNECSLQKKKKNSDKKYKIIEYFASIWEIFAIFAFKLQKIVSNYGKKEDPIQSRLQRHVAEFW